MFEEANPVAVDEEEEDPEELVPVEDGGDEDDAMSGIDSDHSNE